MSLNDSWKPVRGGGVAVYPIFVSVTVDGAVPERKRPPRSQLYARGIGAARAARQLALRLYESRLLESIIAFDAQMCSTVLGAAKDRLLPRNASKVTPDRSAGGMAWNDTLWMSCGEVAHAPQQLMKEASVCNDRKLHSVSGFFGSNANLCTSALRGDATASDDITPAVTAFRRSLAGFDTSSVAGWVDLLSGAARGHLSLRVRRRKFVEHDAASVEPEAKGSTESNDEPCLAVDEGVPWFNGTSTQLQRLLFTADVQARHVNCLRTVARHNAAVTAGAVAQFVACQPPKPRHKVPDSTFVTQVPDATSPHGGQRSESGLEQLVAGGKNLLRRAVAAAAAFLPYGMWHQPLLEQALDRFSSQARDAAHAYENQPVGVPNPSSRRQAQGHGLSALLERIAGEECQGFMAVLEAALLPVAARVHTAAELRRLQELCLASSSAGQGASAANVAAAVSTVRFQVGPHPTAAVVCEGEHGARRAAVQPLHRSPASMHRHPVPVQLADNSTLDLGALPHPVKVLAASVASKPGGDSATEDDRLRDEAAMEAAILCRSFNGAIQDVCVEAVVATSGRPADISPVQMFALPQALSHDPALLSRVQQRLDRVRRCVHSARKCQGS